MTPALRRILDLERQMTQGQAVQGVPSEYRVIQAYDPDAGPRAPEAPKPKPTIDLELGPTTDAEKAKTVAPASQVDELQAVREEAAANLALSQDLNDRAEATLQEAKLIAGPDRTASEAEAKRLRNWAKLVRAGDKLSATLTNRPLDETRYKSLLAEGERGIERAKEKQATGLKIALAGNKSFTQGLAEREADPNSPESMNFRRFFQGTAYGKNVDPEVLKSMSKKDMLGAIGLAQADFNYGKKGEEAVATAGDVNFYKDQLTRVFRKNPDQLPASADALKDEYDREVQTMLSKQARAASEAKAQKAKLEKLTGEVKKYGESRFANDELQRKLNRAIELQESGKTAQGKVLDYLIDDPGIVTKIPGIKAVQNALQEKFTTNEQKEFVRLMMDIAVQKAIADNNGRAPTDGDVRNAITALGLNPSAGSEVNMPALKAALDSARRARESLDAAYVGNPTVIEQYERGIQTAPQRAPAPVYQPKPNSPQQKASTTLKVRRKSDGKVVEMEAAKAQKLAREKSDTYEIVR